MPLAVGAWNADGSRRLRQSAGSSRFLMRVGIWLLSALARGTASFLCKSTKERSLETWKRLGLLPKQIRKRNRNGFCRDLQVFERDPLIGPMSVSLKQRSRTGAVDDGRYTRLAIQTGIGIKRHALGRNVALQRNQGRALQRL